MNEIRRHGREDEEIARIREIVGRHALPEFVTGFDVRLGEIDGDPAVWVVFRTSGERPRNRSAAEERVARLRSLKQAVRPALLEEIRDRFPYVRFEPDIRAGSQQH